MIKFLYNHPAIFIPKEKIIIVSDLHCGIEYSIYKSGISIPSQTRKLKKRIDNLIKLTKAKKLVILGDLKHEVPGTSKQELREIPLFLRGLSKKVKIIIVKGNHDSNIQDLVPKGVEVYGSSGFRIGKYAFLHGQAWMNKDLLKAEYLITAHSHPMVQFISSGFKSTEYCWLKCGIDKKKLENKYKEKIKLKKGIVMPVFNHLIGGMAFNSKGFKPIGPLLRNNVLKWKKAKVYLLDGTYLGRLNKL